MPNQIGSQRTFEAAIDIILEQIEGTNLRSGDRLGTQTTLAETLGISRPTLRQSLRVLERAGVLEVKPGSNGGIFVATEMIPIEALSGGVAREEAAINELLQARRLLEPVAYELAVSAATDADFAEIERSIQLGWRHLHEPRLVIRADAVFHRAMARACHNSVLARALMGIYRELAPARELIADISIDDSRHLLEVHARQLKALRQRDVPALRAALNETFVTLEDALSRVTPVRSALALGANEPRVNLTAARPPTT